MPVTEIERCVSAGLLLLPTNLSTGREPVALPKAIYI